MRWKSLIVAALLGLLAGVFLTLLVGDRIRDDVADSTKDLGRAVQEAGETIEQQAEKLQ